MGCEGMGCMLHIVIIIYGGLGSLVLSWLIIIPFFILIKKFILSIQEDKRKKICKILFITALIIIFFYFILIIKNFTTIQYNIQKCDIVDCNSLSGLSIKLCELGRTYVPGGLSSRIRLQGQISEELKKNPPAAEEVIALFSNVCFKEEVRLFILSSVRNDLAKDVYTGNDAKLIVDKAKETITDYSNLMNKVSAQDTVSKMEWYASH